MWHFLDFCCIFEGKRPKPARPRPSEPPFLASEALEAIQRLLRRELLPFERQIDCFEAPAVAEVEWQRSEKYNLPTKYLKTIFHATAGWLKKRWAVTCEL